MSKPHAGQTASVLPFRRPVEPAFDPIRACEGYLDAFEVQGPEQGSAAYLHGWRKGRLDAQRPARCGRPMAPPSREAVSLARQSGRR